MSTEAEFLERAAQIWCEPQHAHKTMDDLLALSIAAALRESAENYGRAAAEFFLAKTAFGEANRGAKELREWTMIPRGLWDSLKDRMSS